MTELEKLRVERHRLQNDLTAAGLENERLRGIVTGCPVCSELERNIQPSHEPSESHPLIREGWFRFHDGWHPIQRFRLVPGEDEAEAVQNCFPGQRIEFRGAEKSEAIPTRDWPAIPRHKLQCAKIQGTGACDCGAL